MFSWDVGLTRYSSFSSYLIILIFFTGKTMHILPPCNKSGISNFCLEFQIVLKCYSFSSYPIILNFLTSKSRHIVPPYNKAGVLNFHLEFQISLKCYSSLVLFDHSEFLPDKLGMQCHPVTKPELIPVIPGIHFCSKLLLLLQFSCDHLPFINHHQTLQVGTSDQGTSRDWLWGHLDHKITNGGL